MSAGKLLVGVLAGVAVGAIAGILFAPEKGSKTRKRILRKGKDYVEALQDKFDELAGKITHKHDGAQDEAGQLIVNGYGRPAEARQDDKNAVV
jgi:gas vesicle protein